MDPTEDESTGTPENETPATEEAAPTMLDAINASLEPTLPKDESDTDAGTDAESTDEPDGEDEAEDESEADESAERNADGTFKAKQKEAPAADAAAKAAEPKLGADGKPVKADPVNDPIPEEIKGRTRERMTALIDTVKAKDEIITNQHTVIGAVQSTGASPEEFAAMISYMGWMHSDKKEDLTLARDMLLRELEGVSLKLGEPAPGVDFIAKHPDIQTAVNNGQITMEVAQELAMRRSSEATAAERAATAAQNTDAQRQRATTERNSAIAELDTLGATLQENDPDFAEKMKLMPDLKELGKTAAPAQWRATFQAAYKAAGATLAQERQKAKRPGGAPPAQRPAGQPLRANKSPSGGQNRQPTSLLDAVNSALDQHANGN